MLILILANNLINANSINTYLTVCIKHKMVLLSIYSFSQQNHLKIKTHTHTVMKISVHSVRMMNITGGEALEMQMPWGGDQRFDPLKQFCKAQYTIMYLFKLCFMDSFN